MTSRVVEMASRIKKHRGSTESRVLQIEGQRKFKDTERTKDWGQL